MPLSFGVWSPVCGGFLRVRSGPGDASPGRLVRYAQWAETLGYDVYYVSEHHLNAVYGPEHPVTDGWVLASAVVASTERIRVFASVQPGFKQPAVVAKMAAGIAELRPGGFGLGIVAGWWRLEAESYGDTFPAHAERYARAGEFVDVVRGLWTEPILRYAGHYYQVPGAMLEPKPRPRPEVLIAGESERAIELCARSGDWLFVNGDEPERVAALVHKVKRLARERHGRSVRVALSAFGFVRYSRRDVSSYLESLRDEIDRDTVRYFDTQIDGDVVAHQRGSQLDRIDANLGLTAGLIGTPDAILARLGALEQAGVDAVFLKFEPATHEAEAFAKGVIDPYRRQRRYTISPLVNAT
jgi:FMNH2-dependent dimethyl sulfone monooxygenase